VHAAEAPEAGSGRQANTEELRSRNPDRVERDVDAARESSERVTVDAAIYAFSIANER